LSTPSALTGSVAVVSFAVVLGCGGALDPHDTGAGDASLDGATEGGWSNCVSPQGYSICHGPNGCRCPGVDTCLDAVPSDSNNAVSVCFNQPLSDYVKAHDNPTWGACVFCEGVCANLIDVAPFPLSCVPYEIGVLYAAAGAGQRVRYADLGLWRDEPIPTNAGACPAIPGFRLCGPGCGTCPGTNERCVGRAPLHPTGVCVGTNAPTCNATLASPGCGASEACFTFTVEPEAQPIADEYGHCFDAGACAALATSIPGGGRCK